MPVAVHDPAALAYACRCRLALVQVPPRGVWGKTSHVTVTTAESWLGRPLVDGPRLDNVVLRYFGAFGPMTWMFMGGMMFGDLGGGYDGGGDGGDGGDNGGDGGGDGGDGGGFDGGGDGGGFDGGFDGGGFDMGF